MADRFQIVPVNSLSKAMKMRNIRNQVRFFMTHNTEEIGVLQQAAWYASVYKTGEDKAYLVMSGPDHKYPVGYGLVSNRNGEWTVTGALLEDYRGKGIGRNLFTFLTQTALLHSGADVYLDVRVDNLVAFKLYIELGYRPVSVDEENHIIKMKWTGKLVSD
jgi:ribosomal protein S18 acetylase RimI-like enzyme